MATIANYPVLDFSGGVRRDKGAGTLQKNELVSAKNVHLNESGRVNTRLGSQQLGDTLSGIIENSFYYNRAETGAVATTQLLVNTRTTSSGGVMSVLKGTVLTANLAAGATSMTVLSTSQLASSGTVEIDGDLIAYTTIASATSITGVSGVTSAHSSGAPIHQWATLDTSPGGALNARLGVTYAVLNNTLIFTGTGSLPKQYDGTIVSAINNQVGVINFTTWHRRIYGTGYGGSVTNADPRRVSWSNVDDGTTWTTATDYIDVWTTDGSYNTGLKPRGDNLGIFKLSTIFAWDETTLRETIHGVGAYGQKVIQEIDGNLYTFCPNGIFVTNLFSAKSIGEPVKEYFKNFVPIYDESFHIVCTNTFAWVQDKSYFLYIGDITTPEVLNDVVLEYNTIAKAWTVHSGGYTDFAHVNTFTRALFGGSGLISAGQASGSIQYQKDVHIAGDANGKVWRLKENRFINILSSVQTVVGSDIYVDLRSDTGQPISSSFETQMYDLTHPELFKKFKRLRVLTESGQWNIEYRVEDERGVSAYKTLGSVSTTNKSLPFPSEAQGWACGLRVSAVNSNNTATFSGVIFEDTEVVSRP